MADAGKYERYVAFSFLTPLRKQMVLQERRVWKSACLLAGFGRKCLPL
jgi:hypothetical protein